MVTRYYRMAVSSNGNHNKIAVSGMETTTGCQYLEYGNHYMLAVSGMETTSECIVYRN
jgi:hypothetical protein